MAKPLAEISRRLAAAAEVSRICRASSFSAASVMRANSDSMARTSAARASSLRVRGMACEMYPATVSHAASRPRGSSAPPVRWASIRQVVLGTTVKLVPPLNKLVQPAPPL